MPLDLRSRIALYLDLIRWNRPAGWLLLLWPTLAALWVAADGYPGWHLVAVFTLGTILMRSAGCCINVLALLAFALVLTTNALTIAWAFPALAVTVAYPYAKRVVAMPQAVLGVAFSMGIPMAFAAVLGQVPWLALWLVLGNLCWVLAYDTEYAMVDRDDDLKLGMKTSAVTLGRFDVAAIVLFYLLMVVIWAVALSPLALGAIFDSAIALVLVQVAWHWWLIRGRTREGCFKAFRENHWIGFTLFVGIALSYAVR